jgi:hypothetical protein
MGRMNIRDLAFVAITVCASALAQGTLHLPASFAPDGNELDRWNDVPLMRKNARAQSFYDALETGATAFTARELSWRYDGPIPKVGAPGPFTARVRLALGSTAVPLPGASFAQNLSQPLTVAFDQTISYLPDPGSQTPEPWGGPQGGLVFPLIAPVPIAVPAGGWFVVDMSVTDNTNDGLTHALLDGATVAGGPIDGNAFSSGIGCAAAPTAPTATIATSGVHAPGAAHSVHGRGLGAFASVFAGIGFSDSVGPVGPLPFTLPGTTCLIRHGWDAYWVMQADASGAVAAFAPPSLFPVSPNPALSNLTFFEQLASVVPGANPPWGLVFSDLRTVTLGTLSAPPRGIYLVSHKDSASAPVADSVRPFGFALRVR